MKRTGAPFRFNPMNSRERRVIHLALRNETDVRSEERIGRLRHVVVYPAGMASLPELPPAGLPRGAMAPRAAAVRDFGRDRGGPGRARQRRPSATAWPALSADRPRRPVQA